MAKDQFFNEILNFWNFLYDKTKEFEKKIHDVLWSLENGIINSDLIDFEEIKSNIFKIKIQDKGKMISINEDVNVENFKKLVRFGGVVRDGKIFVIFIIPLVSVEKNRVFETIAIPEVVNNVAYSIIIKNRLLIVNKNAEKFFPITELELSLNAVKVDSIFFYKQKVVWNSEKVCEIAIINNDNPNIEANCQKTRFQINNSIIVKSAENNVILVFTAKEINIKFINERVQLFKIIGTNKIVINEAGKLFIEKFEINFPKKLPSVVLNKTIKIEKIDLPFSIKSEWEGKKFNLLNINDSMISHEKLNNL